MMQLRGHGSLHTRLTRAEVEAICSETLARLPLDKKRVLVLLPDDTRHAPVDLFFRVFGDALLSRVEALDYLIATGTHAPMPIEQIYRHTGITADEHTQNYQKVRFFNHQYHQQDQLVCLGTLNAPEVSRITNGLFAQEIPITINRLALEYDHLLVVSPVVPHECMGFSGGNKYFFPGIAGLDLVETFHWLAAVITNPVINGVKITPTRRLIDRAVELLRTPRTCFAFVVDVKQELACLFTGTPEDAWSRAADFSAQLHVRYVDEPYQRVLAMTPPIYQDLWVAGKAMYKLEPVVADGGELVIYAPELRTVSFMHESEILRIGYHTRDYFTQQWERFSQEPKLILAHSTNVKGIGSFENGVERPRITVTLATSLSPATCEQLNLGYRDPNTIDVEAWKADHGACVVESAGQDLYRLQQKPTLRPGEERTASVAPRSVTSS